MFVTKMTVFLVCRRSKSKTKYGNIITSNTFGEYQCLDNAMKRLAEIAKNYTKMKNETVEYYVNELAPPDTYPLVKESYYLDKQ